MTWSVMPGVTSLQQSRTCQTAATTTKGYGGKPSPCPTPTEPTAPGLSPSPSAPSWSTAVTPPPREAPTLPQTDGPVISPPVLVALFLILAGAVLLRWARRRTPRVRRH
jgi:hypothetical protein